VEASATLTICRDSRSACYARQAGSKSSARSVIRSKLTKKERSAKLNNNMKAKSTVNASGNYTKPAMRKRMFSAIKAGSKGGNPGQWSARKAQLLANNYKKAGGGYTN
jgi:hypothetical protein